LESRAAVLKVTRGPFLDSGGGRMAYVVHDGVAQRVAIETGGASISEVEILAGLNVGDQIIISNLGELERAERVRLTQ
jgi:HlyD family secretion protein